MLQRILQSDFLMQASIEATVGLFAALIGATVIIKGWAIVHRKELERDHINQKRVHRQDFLISAYRRIHHIAARPMTDERRSDIEITVADIQLFGTPTQIEVARNFAGDVARGEGGNLTVLLDTLRDDLREQLALEKAPPLFYFRFDD